MPYEFSGNVDNWLVYQDHVYQLLNPPQLVPPACSYVPSEPKVEASNTNELLAPRENKDSKHPPKKNLKEKTINYFHRKRK